MNQPKEHRWQKLESVKCLGIKSDYRRRICKQPKVPGDWVEFGVYKGKSANVFLKYGVPKDAKLYLFDSWQGLPEDWTGHASKVHGPINKGAMKCDIPTFNDPRAVIVNGWFDKTLPKWVAKYKKDFLSFVHIDCDIYSSTKTIFDNIHHLITPDTVLAFDEFCGYASWRDHEYKAFMEYVKRHNLSYEFLARSVTQAQVAVRVWKRRKLL